MSSAPYEIQNVTEASKTYIRYCNIGKTLYKILFTEKIGRQL